MGFEPFSYDLLYPTYGAFVDTNNIDIDCRVSLNVYSSKQDLSVFATLESRFVIGLYHNMVRIEPIVTFSFERSGHNTYFNYYRMFTGNFIPAIIVRNNTMISTVVEIENNGSYLSFYPIELLQSGDVLKINTTLTYSH